MWFLPLRDICGRIDFYRQQSSLIVSLQNMKSKWETRLHVIGSDQWDADCCRCEAGTLALLNLHVSPLSCYSITRHIATLTRNMHEWRCPLSEYLHWILLPHCALACHKEGFRPVFPHQALGRHKAVHRYRKRNPLSPCRLPPSDRRTALRTVLSHSRSSGRRVCSHCAAVGPMPVLPLWRYHGKPGQLPGRFHLACVESGRRGRG